MISKIRLLICNIINFSSKVNSDNVPAYSAHASFFLFISAFPFIMILMTLIKYTPLTEEILLQFVGNLAPNALGETVISWINEIYRDSVGILSISIILTLWAASKGFLGIISSLNFIYDTPFKKNYFFKRFIAMFYTLALQIGRAHV